MKIRLIWLMILAIMLVLATWPVLTLTEENLTAQADDLYAKRFDIANVKQAIDMLEKSGGQDYETLWRLARCYWFLGDRAKGKEQRLPLFEKAKSYAGQAVKADDNGIDGHYWLASLTGCVGQEKGILNSLFMVGPMKKELDRCLQIDPKHGEAHDVVAQLYWLVPGPPLSIGNKKKALEEATLATTYGPQFTSHWLHLGQIAKDNKNYTAARSALQKVLAMEDDPEDPESSQKDKKAAGEELKKIEGKK